MLKTVTMDFQYMNLIANPPGATPTQMYSQACQNDKVTVEAWRETWIKNVKANKAIKGSFKDNGIGKDYGIYDKKPCILAGAGPSLKGNIESLKDTKGIPIVSVLHNFHFMEDNNIPVDYYVSLDCQDIVVDEMAEGGKKSLDEYFEITKDRTLVAFIGSPPKLIERWKGPVKFFNCPIPDDQVLKAVDETERFWTYVSTGGNVLGAAAYVARAFFGATPLAFVGSDFSFSYENKFHGWDSKYDKNLGQALRAIDVYGHGVFTWQSYYNFKVFFDWLSQKVAGIYINCSEGGIMGAYPEGILQNLKPMDLKDFVGMYSMYEVIKDQCLNPETTQERRILY